MNSQITIKRRFLADGYRKYVYPANLRPTFYLGTLTDGHKLRLLRRKCKKASQALIYAARVAVRLNRWQPGRDK